MLKYIVKRLAMGVVTMFFLITITFWLTRLMPGSPFATDNISPSVLATLEANYGFNKPIDQQFVIYLQSLLQGNLGVSYTRTGVTVNDLIAQGFPVTLKLAKLTAKLRKRGVSEEEMLALCADATERTLLAAAFQAAAEERELEFSGQALAEKLEKMLGNTQK